MIYVGIFFTRFEFVSLHLIIMQAANQMNQGKSIFAQVMSLFPEYIFRQCVARYKGDRHKIKYTCRDQFMVMSFAQFTSQQSLRTNEAALTAFESKLYHSGLTLIPRSSLSDLNEQKDWRIYHDLAMYLVKKARKLYDKDYYRLDIDDMVYAFDSSTIELCLKQDYATNNVYTFITNASRLPALTIAELYRERWNVETFFKFIKGRLHIKSFYGTSRNEVYTQIWIAVCDYLLLVIAKKMFHIDCELYILAQSIGLVLFEREPINQIFERNKSNNKNENDGQLSLWLNFSGQ